MSEVFCSTTQVALESFKTLSSNNSGLYIFRIELSSYYHLVPELTRHLTVSEMQHAQKYHFEKDRNQFVICRTLLKFILAKFTGLSLEEISIKNDSNKKPYLSSKKSIHFNVSHSENMAIIILNNAPVGIDLEFLNERFDFSEMLPSIYNTAEIETVLNSENKIHTFYKFWTRKESIVKATGQGVSDFLPQIPALDGLHTVEFKYLDGFKNFKVYSFDLDEDHVASISIISENIELNKLQIYNLPNSIDDLIAFSSFHLTYFNL